MKNNLKKTVSKYTQAFLQSVAIIFSIIATMRVGEIIWHNTFAAIVFVVCAVSTIAMQVMLLLYILQLELPNWLQKKK